MDGVVVGVHIVLRKHRSGHVDAALFARPLEGRVLAEGVPRFGQEVVAGVRPEQLPNAVGDMVAIAESIGGNLRPPAEVDEIKSVAIVGDDRLAVADFKPLESQFDTSSSAAGPRPSRMNNLCSISASGSDW